MLCSNLASFCSSGDRWQKQRCIQCWTRQSPSLKTSTSSLSSSVPFGSRTVCGLPWFISLFAVKLELFAYGQVCKPYKVWFASTCYF
jgi:hypothetical protein